LSHQRIRPVNRPTKTEEVHLSKAKEEGEGSNEGEEEE
jgi:hypothetical protein